MEIKKSSILVLLIVLLSSCGKEDLQHLIVGTWNIQSVTFNGDEKKSDPSLHGITHYEITYDTHVSLGSPPGGMKGKTNSDSMIIGFPFEFIGSDSILVHYQTLDTISGSYLPDMIDTSHTFVDIWKIVQLDKHTFISQLVYQNNTYILTLSK